MILTKGDETIAQDAIDVLKLTFPLSFSSLVSLGLEPDDVDFGEARIGF
jgi:hypothetical protein